MGVGGLCGRLGGCECVGGELNFIKEILLKIKVNKKYENLKFWLQTIT